MITIVNRTVDIAKKHRFWVELDDGEVIMLKFHTKPLNSEVIAEAEAYVQRIIDNAPKEKERRLEEIDEEIARLEDEKSELSAKE